MTTDTPREIELKLRSTAEALASVRPEELLADHLRGRPRLRRLSSIYYDTPDHSLAARGMALRVRKIGRRHVQTLKGEAAAGSAAADRPEWETVVAGAQPEPEALPEEARAQGGLCNGVKLVPLFATRFSRRSMLVAWQDDGGTPALVELAVDRGRIEGGELEEPIGEVELELKEGPVAALFDLAATLRRSLPLAIETRAKAQRGFALATGSVTPAFKPGRPVLGPDDTVEDGLEAILRQGLAQWIRNEPAARDGRDPEGVHQMRVGLRRLRAALALFRDVLPPEAHERWDGELRWLMGELGPARDLDVFADEVMAPVAATEGLGELLEGLAGAVGERRRAAYASLRATLAGARYGDLLLELAAWVETRGWRRGVEVDRRLAQQDPLRPFAARALERRWRKVRKAGRGFARLAPEERHILRVRVKKLRYGVEFLAGVLDGKSASRLAARLARLQDALGHMNDLTVARRLAAEALELPGDPALRERAALGAGLVMGWHGARNEQLGPKLVACWRAVRRSRRFWKKA